MNLSSSKDNNRQNFPIARDVEHGNDCLENLGSLTNLQEKTKLLPMRSDGDADSVLMIMGLSSVHFT